MSAPTSLLELILNLLRDPAELAKFQDDPDSWMASCGIEDVHSQDIYEALVLADDHNSADFDSDKNTGGNTINVVPPHHPPAPHEGESDHEAAVRYLNTYITNNYIDDRDTDASTTINQQVDTGGGDFDQEIDVDTVVASGDGAVAAGGDIEDSNIATGDDNVVGDGAIGVTGDGNTTAVGGDATSTTFDDVNTGDGSGFSVNGNASGAYSDDDTDTDIDNYGDGDVNSQVVDDGSSARQGVDQSETSESTSYDLEVEDSFNSSIEETFTDNSETNIASNNELDVEVEIDNSVDFAQN